MANGGHDSDQDVLEQMDAIENASDNVPGLKAQIEQLRTEFKNSTDAQQKRAIAAALPNIAKGVLSAVTAFQQQPPDAIGGTAAIMDMLAGVSAALGPEGAVVGALFSMISMILNFFEPKQPSLLDQMETLMRNLEGEDWRTKLEGVGNTTNTYANVCDAYIKEPPGSDDPQHNGVRDPGALTIEVSKLNLVDGNAIVNIWDAQGWLNTPANQDLDVKAWPEILNLHCEVYTRLRLAVTRQYIYAFDKDGKGTDGKTRSERYIDNPNDGWQQRQTGWRALQDQLDVKFRNLVQSDLYTRMFLNEILPVARKRGLHIFHWAYSDSSSGDVKLASGPKAYQGGGDVQTLRGGASRVSITPPRGGVNDAEAQYDVWIIDTNNATRQTLNLETGALRAQQDVLGPATDGHNSFADLWPAPMSDPNMFQIFVAMDTSGFGELQQYEWNSAAKSFNKVSWQPSAGSRMSQVRVVMDPTALSDDPDGKIGMPNQIIYAKIEGSSQIFVWANGNQYSVQTPWSSYTGISIDQHFLWLYGTGGQGQMCTSHASVMSHLNNKPRWLGSSRCYGGDLLDLSSCEDGTVLIVATDNHASCANYHVDFTQDESHAVIFETWEDLPGGGGIQCQKLPIFGWARAQGLATILSQPVVMPSPRH